MSSPLWTREQVVQHIDWALRELSTSTVLAATAIAQKVGMGPNDLRCGELLVRNGPMTAGELAKATGLTTGAITGIVDRLEKAGWAQRRADPGDRRRVVIYPGPQENKQTAAALYAGHVERMNQLLAQYSDEQLILLLEFVQRLAAINRDEAGRG
jgi:DNA-binding MarR family transcriptional regulator